MWYGLDEEVYVYDMLINSLEDIDFISYLLFVIFGFDKFSWGADYHFANFFHECSPVKIVNNYIVHQRNVCLQILLHRKMKVIMLETAA